MTLYHATCIVLGGAGVLLEGPSGSGKSDLALRLMAEGAKLVGDDYITLRERSGTLIASAPENIAGKMEVRGIGLVKVDHVGEAPVALAIELRPRRDVPRLPGEQTKTIAGVTIRSLILHAFDASTPAKILLALKSD